MTRGVNITLQNVADKLWKLIINNGVKIGNMLRNELV